MAPDQRGEVCNVIIVGVHADRPDLANSLLYLLRQIHTDLANNDWHTYQNDPSHSSNCDQMPYLAMTIYGEAEGQNLASKIAVGWVIRNRVEANNPQWGTTYEFVVKAPAQFDCWFPGPNNLGRIENASGPAWQQSMAAAQQVMASPASADAVPGALQYYSPATQEKKEGYQVFQLKNASGHGVDVVAYNPKENELYVYEAKTTTTDDKRIRLSEPQKKGGEAYLMMQLKKLNGNPEAAKINEIIKKNKPKLVPKAILYHLSRNDNTGLLKIEPVREEEWLPSTPKT